MCENEVNLALGCWEDLRSLSHSFVHFLHPETEPPPHVDV